MRTIFCSFLAVLTIHAEEPTGAVEPKTLPAPDQKVEPMKPALEKIEGPRYRLGAIEFDQSTREIRVPVQVNMNEGLLEFILVHKDGKVHESLLRTDISATQLNVVFNLLRYKPSRELYNVVDASGRNLGPEQAQEVADEAKQASRVNLSVEWQQDGATKRVPINEWISHAVTEKVMPPGPWVYGGSEVENGRFAPESTGDIVAIFLTNSAMVLYPGVDNRNDDVWLPFPKRIPPLDTRATLIFSPVTPATKPTAPKP